uniref:Uncharacterized protein n=1 Tax=Tanacetum cinerariifolium TaxID=118510 RepID=A0A6L2J0Z4_TANCI|nr:hypothetical protein CTI12_AA402440 [Tanacetum cinerariifolium]
MTMCVDKYLNLSIETIPPILQALVFRVLLVEDIAIMDEAVQAPDTDIQVSAAPSSARSAFLLGDFESRW